MIRLIVFIILMTSKAIAGTSVSVFPFFNYLDLDFTQEIAFHSKNTVLFNVNLNKKSCPDCSDSGTASGTGFTGVYRHYLNQVSGDSWFADIGIGMFKGRAKETKTGVEEKKTVREIPVNIGKRSFFGSGFFFEWTVGAIFRSESIHAGDYKGYNKNIANINFALGYHY